MVIIRSTLQVWRENGGPYIGDLSITRFFTRLFIFVCIFPEMIYFHAEWPK
jgi:hypothetical protein